MATNIPIPNSQLQVDIRPVTLEGTSVRLEPLTLAHHDSLCEVGLDPELWKWTMTVMQDREDMWTYIEAALTDQAGGTALPFAIIERATNRTVGSTRYGNIDRTNRRLEIGWTWIAPPWQQTAINTETKLVLLTHAFETLGCIRVEFKTDSMNTQSRRALLRIGATEEGTLRNHMITPTGRIRSSVYFSILAVEWPGIRDHLRGLLSMKK